MFKRPPDKIVLKLLDQLAVCQWQSRDTQRTESLKFKTESVLKKYLIVPAYLNFRNDLNVVLNFSVDIIRFRHQS